MMMSDSENESMMMTSDSDNDNTLATLRKAIREKKSVKVVQSILMGRLVDFDLLDLRDAVEESMFYRYQTDPDVTCALILHDPEVVQIPDWMDRLLLHHALFQSAPLQVVQLLLELYPAAAQMAVESYRRNENGETEVLPLHLACDSDIASVEIIELLLSYYPPGIQQATADGFLPLHYTTWGGASLAVIQLVYERFPEAIQVRNEEGSLPLAYCYDRLDATRLLVEHFPDSLRLPDEYFDLPLHCALQSKASLNVVRFMVEQYPESVRLAGSEWFLPIHCAALSCSEDVVEFLIEQYPDGVYGREAHGALPIHEAHLSKSCRVIQLLLDHYEGEPAQCRGLAVRDDGGQIPLHKFAPKFSNRVREDNLQLVLQQYPDGVRVADDRMRLPLHLACNGVAACALRVIRLLVETDLYTVLTAREDGMTPLEISFQTNYQRRRQYLETRRFLLEKQDEAVRLLHGAFQPVAERHRLPAALVLAEIWTFVLPPLWWPTENEMNVR